MAQALTCNQCWQSTKAKAKRRERERWDGDSYLYDNSQPSLGIGMPFGIRDYKCNAILGYATLVMYYIFCMEFWEKGTYIL
jgi:hypothetical protein